MSVLPALKSATDRITAVELYRYDVTVPRHFSFGNWDNRQHGFLRVCTAGDSGWGEVILSTNRPDLDTRQFGACYRQLLGMSIADAVDLVWPQLETWGAPKTELAEMALVDLAGKVMGCSSLELLALDGRGFVPGLECILQNQPEQVEVEARRALDKNLRTHTKLKLFGDLELDLSLIGAARRVLGKDTFLIGDVNRGYRPTYSDQPLDSIADSMRRLHAEGLTACEDPAELTAPQWVSLQGLVGPLDLIPDYPTRPARSAIRSILPGMGRIFNMHPSRMGSLIDVVQLGRRIQSFGAKLMVGDDSLVGPACTVWQQLAIGLKADWVEALEKEESAPFLGCVRQQATAQQADGRFGVKQASGFGLEIDTGALRKVCRDCVAC